MPRSSQSRWNWSRDLVLLTIASVGIALSVIGYWAFARSDARLFRSELENQSKQRITAIQRRLRSDVLTLAGRSPLVRRVQPGEREEFRTVARDLLAESGDILALAWIPRIKADEQAQHEAQMQSAGMADYRIWSWSSGATDHADADEAEQAMTDRYPILFIQPFQTHRRWIGFGPGQRSWIWRHAERSHHGAACGDHGSNGMAGWVRIVSGVRRHAPCLPRRFATRLARSSARKVIGPVRCCDPHRSFSRERVRVFRAGYRRTHVPGTGRRERRF